jgi:hypothetical protein
MKALTLVLGAILALALGGCAEDPVNRNIAILKSPTSTPEQKAAARRFLEWELAQNQRDLEYQRQLELARASRPVYSGGSNEFQQEQLDRIEQQNRDIQQDLENQQAAQINGGHW